MKKLAIRIVLVLAVVIPVYFLIRGYFRTERERVQRVIDAVASGLERENVWLSLHSIFEHVSDSYRHNEGRREVGKQEALVAVRGYKQRYVEFRVELKDIDITVIADTAKAELTGRITAAKKDDPEKRIELITRDGWNRAVIYFEKEDGEWLVTGSERLRRKWGDAVPD